MSETEDTPPGVPLWSCAAPALWSPVQVGTLARSLRVLLDEGDVLLHVIRGAQHHGHPLVDGLGLDVQHVHGPSGGHSPRLLRDKGHGVALVQQPQLLGEEEGPNNQV